MRQVPESPNWNKVYRMSRFVQSGRMTFEKMVPDEIPLTEVGSGKVFHILLKNGIFGLARLEQGDYGGCLWRHPIEPAEFFESGIRSTDMVLAWKVAIDQGCGRFAQSEPPPIWRVSRPQS